MQVAFPTSLPVARKTDNSPIYAGFTSLLNTPGYSRMLERKVEQGDRLVMFGLYYDDTMAEIADTMITWVQDSDQLRGDKDGLLVMVQDEGDYESASKDDRVSVIAVATSHLSPYPSFDRVSFLRSLVDQGKFCTDKEHWLYGVPNPAELSIYGEIFSGFVVSKIKLAICSTCFIYSVFGVHFSRESGILERLWGVDDIRLSDLGMGRWIDYTMSKEQIRCFHMNVDVVEGFASGSLKAHDYVERVHSYGGIKV